MKKSLAIFFGFAFLIGGIAAHADAPSPAHPIDNLKKIEENAARERARQEAYEKATKPRPPAPKPAAPKPKTGG